MLVAATPAPNVQGIAVDDTTGRPIVGARVVISQDTPLAGATPPASDRWPTATTGPTGAFDVTNVSPSTWTESFTDNGPRYPIYRTAQWVSVFSPDGHAAYHAILSISPTGTTHLGVLHIALPSVSDNAWLAQINTDRATMGTPAVTTPLIFDSITLRSARYWATQMATLGFFDHQCPASASTCEEYWLWQTQRGSLPSSQNIYYGASDWREAESGFMEEVSLCSRRRWKTCAYTEDNGHFVNIMAATDWAGVGIAIGLDPTTQAGTATPYYVENFSTSDDQ